MNNPLHLITELFQLRNKYGGTASEKIALIERINPRGLKSKRAIEAFYNTLLFILAYPDSKTIYNCATASLKKLEEFINETEVTRRHLYNTGISGSVLSAQYSFEIVKWLRETFHRQVSLDSITAHDAQVTSVISAVMPQVESEILQDENILWKTLLKKFGGEGEELFDNLIHLFEQSLIRPEVKDELWAALGIIIAARFTKHIQLPQRLTSVYYHHSLNRGASLKHRFDKLPEEINLSTTEALKIIECARTILVCNFRELDPISFSEPSQISFYRLSRGLSIAVTGMRFERRHPIDCYLGYIIFKNGLPTGYGGSWILFDSARIALNIFPPYRGGESLHIFEQVLKLHCHIFNLNRITADPYQVGANNSDAIKSGAFWTYYKLGFRPMHEDLRQLAQSEAGKINAHKNYRSPASVLRKLSGGRLELIIQKDLAVRFDATDLSLLYIAIVKKNYSGNSKIAERECYKQLLNVLELPENIMDETLKYILKNWCVILMGGPPLPGKHKNFGAALKKIFFEKAHGSESEYIRLLQKNNVLRKLVENQIAINL